LELERERQQRLELEQKNKSLEQLKEELLFQKSQSTQHSERSSSHKSQRPRGLQKSRESQKARGSPKRDSQIPRGAQKSRDSPERDSQISLISQNSRELEKSHDSQKSPDPHDSPNSYHSQEISLSELSNGANKAYTSQNYYTTQPYQSPFLQTPKSGNAGNSNIPLIPILFEENGKNLNQISDNSQHLPEQGNQIAHDKIYSGKRSSDTSKENVAKRQRTNTSEECASFLHKLSPLDVVSEDLFSEDSNSELQEKQTKKISDEEDKHKSLKTKENVQIGKTEKVKKDPPDGAVLPKKEKKKQKQWSDILSMGSDSSSDEADYFFL